MNIVERLREWAKNIRRKPAPLSDAIPMVCEAADCIEALEKELAATKDRLSEERDIWDRMLGDAAEKFERLEHELDACLYVLEALWDKKADLVITEKWAQILTRNKRVTGASSAEDS